MDVIGFALAQQVATPPVVIAGSIRDLTTSFAKGPLAIVGDTLYRGGDTGSNSEWRAVDLKTGTTTAKTSIPSALVESPTSGFRNANVIGTNIYVTSGTTNAFQMYDTVTNTWTAKANHPDTIGAYLVYVASDGQYLYSGGGGNVPKRYDPGTNTWAASGSVTVGQNISGMSYLTERGTGRVWAWHPSPAAWEVWDPATGTKTAKATVGFSRYKPYLFIVGDDIYAASGDDNANAFSPDVYVYSKTSNTWVFAARIPRPVGRSHMAAAVTPDNCASFLVAAGGEILCTRATKPDVSALLAHLAAKQ